MAPTNTNTVQPQTLPSSSIQKGADILISLIENERAKSAADARHELHELKNQFAQFRESSARQLQEAEQASREARTQAHLLWNERYLAIENERDKLKQTLQLAAAAFHRQMSLLQVEIDVLKKARSTQPENDGQRLSHNQKEEPYPSSREVSVSLKADSDIQPPNAWNQADQARRGLQTPRANQLPNISTDPNITQSTTQSSAASSTQSTHNPPPTSSSANNPESTPPCLSGKLLHSHDWDIAVPSTGAVLKPLHERQAPPPSFLQTVQSHPAHPPVAINASPLSALGLGATETDDGKGSLKRPSPLSENASQGCTPLTHDCDRL